MAKLGDTMTVGELRQLLEGLDSWMPVYAQCVCNLAIHASSRQTVSGHDDGTPMIALHLDRQTIKDLSKAFNQK